MRRKIIRWIAIIVLLVAMGVLLSWLLGNRHDVYRLALGMSLGVLGLTFTLLTLWPKAGQSDLASVVFALPQWVVAIGARWRVRWRLVTYAAWGMLFLLSLTVVAVALFGDSEIALLLGLVVSVLNALGLLYVSAARVPADRRQQ